MLPDFLGSSQVENSIVRDIRRIPTLSYLASFYEDYLAYYMTSRETSGGLDSTPLTGAARSVDLPFVGKSVLSTGIAKFMFVFEGSLQKETRLSITVLSCLWALDDITPYRDLVQLYWNMTSYNRVHRSLSITPGIASEAYVVDAFRIGNAIGNRDTKRNRALLHEEIRLLRPEHIILVGNTARDIIGREYAHANNRCFHVPFPTSRMAPLQRQAANQRYESLAKLFEMTT